jgi:hypothetical protein
MKVRTNFVSNSSSTSFLCDFCGEEFSGMDLSPSEVEHSKCENHHIICDGSTLDGYDEWKKVQEEKLKKEDKNNPDMDDRNLSLYEEREIPSKFCPLCQFQKVSHNDIVEYAIKLTRKTRKELAKEIQTRFSSYSEFQSFLRK